MGWRITVAVVVLALLGVGVGYAVGASDEASPRSVDATPVTARSPSFPRESPVVIRPDPDDPALQRNLATTPDLVGGPQLGVQVLVPDGWVKVSRTLGEWRFFVPDPALNGQGVKPNTYFMRVTLTGNRYQSISAALDDRIAALAGAEDVKNFKVESKGRDTFVGTYVSGGFQRVTMERFIASPAAPGQAYALIGIIGRERDREGMTSLLEKVTDNAIGYLAEKDG